MHKIYWHINDTKLRGFIIRTFAVLFCAISIISCCHKTVERVVTEIEYRDRIIHDSVTIEIEKEVLKNVTADTTSSLETSYARSTATISGGLLTHTLENNPQIITKPIDIHVTDTIIKTQIVKIPEPVIQEVEKELTWGQRVRLDTYYILLGLILIYIIIRYRKGLLSIIKALLS